MRYIEPELMLLVALNISIKWPLILQEDERERTTDYIAYREELLEL